MVLITSASLQVLGELPEHCAFTLVYGLPIYWLAGLNAAPDRFLLSFMLVWLMVYCSRCMALFVAASLPTLQTSAFMGNAFFTIFYLTGGFVINLENMWLGKGWGAMIFRSSHSHSASPPPPPLPPTQRLLLLFLSLKLSSLLLTQRLLRILFLQPSSTSFSSLLSFFNSVLVMITGVGEQKREKM